MKEPFLSTATNKTVELLEQRTPDLITFSSDPTRQPQSASAGSVVVNRDCADVNLFKLTMYFIGDIAGEVLMGKAFHENNPWPLKGKCGQGLA